MADVRALFTQHFDAARAALSDGDQTAAAASLRAAVLAARSDPNLGRELASALLQLGKLVDKMGQGAEAEQHLSEALAISERLFGMEHPALGPLLNELSRLHIQQSHHTRAEAALERLLGIARGKGEEHPEVATALAGLAMVKRRTGDDAAAEALYRDALHIREKVLAPDHMVTVVTLEQLSETCAARGKMAEALGLLQRALPTREAALGAEHPSVSGLKAKMATLELQVSAATAADPKELVFLYKPEPRKRRSAAPAPPAKKDEGRPFAAAAVTAVAAVPTPKPAMAPPAPAAPQIMHVSPEPLELSADAFPMLSGNSSEFAVPRRHSSEFAAPRGTSSEFAAPRRESSAVLGSAVRVDTGTRAAAKREPARTASTGSSKSRRSALIAFAGVAMVGIAAAGMTLRSKGGGDPAAASVGAEPAAAVIATASAATAPARHGTSPAMDAPHVELQGAVKGVPLPTPAPATPARPQPVARAPEPEIEAPAPQIDVPSVRLDLGKVNVPTVAAMNVDSLVRTSSKLDRDARAELTGSKLSRAPRIERVAAAAKSSDDDEPVASRPTVIGKVPSPRFPESLRSTMPEGEVIVRFEVNTSGRIDVGGMTVVKSDHDLFTAAVRNILPLYRFEPAHTPPPDSKPVAVWVELPFKFSAKR